MVLHAPEQYGEKWLDSYIHTLKESDKKKMENTQSRRAYRFGDGQVVHSTKKVPAKIEQIKCHIETEVVPVDIPLLFILLFIFVFFFDNGGEFNNVEMRDMAENFDIEVKTTAAYSPWCNVLCERHNQTLTEC